jgi:hypothetical protein
MPIKHEYACSIKEKALLLQS